MNKLDKAKLRFRGPLRRVASEAAFARQARHPKKVVINAAN